MLLDTWFGKGPKKNLSFDVKCPVFSRTQAEIILGELILQNYLTEDFQYTPYSTISYLKKGNYMYIFILLTWFIIYTFFNMKYVFYRSKVFPSDK